MKISLLEPLGITEELVNKLAKPITDAGHEFVYFNEKTPDPAVLLDKTADSNIVMISNTPYPTSVIENAKNLKMISVAFTGIDHIDCDSCKNKGITISNAAGYSNQTVAELVIGMAINALRKMIDTDKITRSGGTSAGLTGGEIAGKTVGIIGLGQIGLMCAKLFLAFGANVIAYNRSENEEAKKLGIEYKSIKEVLSQSDIISLNLPSNRETKGFIDAEKIALMKPDAIFINCARGAIVDNAALADALNSDKLGYACIDVYDMEPPIPADYPLLSAKNTLLTPHQAFISKESMIRRANIVFNNVYSYLNGTPTNVCKL